MIKLIGTIAVYKSTIIATLMLSLLDIEVLYAGEHSCYSAFLLSDSVQSGGVMHMRAFSDTTQTKGILHVRRVTGDSNDVQDKALIWLQPLSDKSKDELQPPGLSDGINIPYLIDLDKKGFRISNIRSPLLDQDLIMSQLGLIDSYQYSEDAHYATFIRADGFVRVEQALSFVFPWQRPEFKVERMELLGSDMGVMPNVEIENSEIHLTEGECVFHDASGEELVLTDYPGLNSNVTLNRSFSVHLSDVDKLNSGHWFFSLSTDISTWPWRTIVAPEISEVDAEEIYLRELDSLTEIHEDGNKLESWIIKNISMLKHLGSILTQSELDDEISKDLFRVLGAMNSTDSIDVLSNVLVAEGAGESHRYRALVALEGTNAPFSDEAIREVIEYSATPRSEYDHVDQAALMLLGTYAGKRAQRVPEQAVRFEDAVIDTMNDNTIPPIYSLSAAGNAQRAASDRLVENVEQHLVISLDTDSRRVGAESLRKMGRTDIKVDTIDAMIKEEGSSLAREELIRLSPLTEGALSSNELQLTLLDVIGDTGNTSEVRVAAIQALDNLGFGEIETERNQVMSMISGEKDRDVSKELLRLWSR